LVGIEDFMFNEPVLEDTEDVILCNGVFDVLSLAQSRLPGVSVPYWLGFKERHVKLLKDKRVFICMGNDELGRRESIRIQTMLQQSAMETYIVSLPESIRDINDFFVRVQNPVETFIRMLNQTLEEAFMVPIAPDSNHISIYTEEYMKRYRGQVSGISSGLSQLDEALFGGFGCGLYLLTGAASIGKSMLMKQMADHIALEENPVIFVSWDMTGFELWARSIARIIGVEPQQVMNGKLEPDQISKANASYIPISKMLWTLECSLETTLDKVIASIEKIAKLVGKMPIVFIDHLQRVPISDGKTVPTTLIERNTMISYALKQWSKEANVTIIAAMPVGDTLPIVIPEGVKASADVIMLLSPQGVSDDGDSQYIALQLLKNRNGSLMQIPLVFQHHKALISQ
jgi:replicative DNA helicase